VAEAATPIGQDRAWLAALAQAERAARSPWPVLIQGPTGCGKELVARAYHAASPRKLGPFVAVNCGALHHERYEHDLFGFAKGAYTGADKPGWGFFRMAHGGTLFLDELGRMPFPVQVKLLRAIQEGVVRPVGHEQDEPVDVRIIAATNQPIDPASPGAVLLEDLWYRLSVTVIRVPSLAERPGDILPLAEHFLARDAQLVPGSPTAFDAGACTALKAHTWPGNVRELECAVRRALVSHEGAGAISVSDLGLVAALVTEAETPPTDVPLPRLADGTVDFVSAVTRFSLRVVAERLKQECGIQMSHTTVGKKAREARLALQAT
jgi:DNA-binding NtrC family response regulator